MEIFKLFGSILVDSKEAEKSISKTDSLAQKLGKGLGSGIKTAAKWGVAIGAAAVGAGAAMFAATKKVTDSFDNIAKTSAKLGVSTDAYQEMEYWASQNGISAGNMERAVGRLNQRIGMAAEGNEKYAEALKRLGVDMDGVKNGTVSTEDAMYQSIQTLSEMTNEQEKSALASELFGTKLARELMPALQDNSMTMDDAREAAERLGIVIGEDTITAGVSFQDNLTDMKASLSAVGQNIMAYLIPVFNNMTDWVLENMPKIQEVAGKVFDFIGKVVTAVVEVVRDHFIPALINLWEWVEPHLPAIKQFFEDAFELAKDVISRATDAIKSAIDWVEKYWHILEPILIGIGAGVAVFAAIQGAIALYNVVIGIATGVTTGFGAALAFVTSPIGIAVIAIGALIAIGVALYKNWDTVKEKAGQLGSYLKTKFNDVKNAIMTPIKSAIDFVKGQIDRLKGFFSGLKLSIPKPKLPKFSLSGKFSLAPPSVPKLNVAWNAEGGIFSKPTIFNTANAGLQGVGEAGSEVIAPLSKLEDLLGLNKDDNNSSSLIEMLVEIMDLLRLILEKDSSFHIDGKVFARLIGDYTGADGGQRVRRIQRGLAT